MNEQIKKGADIHSGDGGYSIGTQERYEEFAKNRNYKKGYTDCDCGCNEPVAETPEEMLRFLAGRLEYAGTSDGVAAIYARDIRYVLNKYYGESKRVTI
jgi:hypothetical protein